MAVKRDKPPPADPNERKAAVEALRQRADVVSVATRVLRLNLKADGAERFKTRCPMPGHGPQRGKSPPFTLFRGGGFKCFGCDAKGGDGISLYAQAKGLDKRRDFSRIVEELGPYFGATIPKPQLAAAPAGRWTPSAEPPVELTHKTHGTPSHAWRVLDADGRLFALHCRFETAEGKTFAWWRNGQWTLAGLKVASAPLYGAELLSGWNQDTAVFLTEGERAADALRARGLQAVATVCGSGTKPGAEVLAVLGGWRGPVILWPDFDDPGRSHMERVRVALPPGLDVRTFAPSDLPPKGDAVQWLTTRAAETSAGETLAEILAGAVKCAPEADRADEAPDLDRLIATELRRERARREARRLLAAEERGPEPEMHSLDALLAEEREPVRYRVEGWLAVKHRGFLVAAFKSGKTSLRDNLVRCLVDGDPFLDRYVTHPLDGPVVLFDTEMDKDQGREWLRDQGIRNPSRVKVFFLRGQVATFDLLDAEVRGRWAARLREVGARFVVLDCLRPCLDALGLDEKTDAGRFLVPFDAMLSAAGVEGALVIHHMGHQSERSRGDSRMRDWPDVEIRMVRENPDDPASPRYISAYGRDVEQPEQLLAYDKETRRLSVAGGSRKDAKHDAILADVCDVLRASGPLSKRKIETALEDSEHGRDAVRAALSAGLRRGCLTVTEGARRSHLYSVSEIERASAR